MSIASLVFGFICLTAGGIVQKATALPRNERQMAFVCCSDPRMGHYRSAQRRNVRWWWNMRNDNHGMEGETDPSSSSSSSSKPSSSIADYTLGLHGGKYQFADAGYNPMGQAFAESLYADDSSSSESGPSADEPLPRWFQSLVLYAVTRENQYQRGRVEEAVLSVSSRTAPSEVVVTNEEMTWEQFYAVIVPTQGGEIDSSNGIVTNWQSWWSSSTAQRPSMNAFVSFSTTQPVPFRVQPALGELARRGGSVTLRVSHGDSVADSTNYGAVASSSWCLVVGTESAGQWIFHLQG